MEDFHQIINSCNDILWGIPMLVLLFGTHLYLTFRLGFIQRFTLKGIKLSLKKENSQTVGDISPFGSLATALAATIGTGNIVGVATAIALGGPGAVLWMWLTGVFGIATKYAEAYLSVKYRTVTSDGTMLGGPMYVLEKGLKAKWLGILFAIFTVIASFGIGNMAQANSITSLLSSTFGLSTHLIGIILMIITGAVILGGIKSISNVCTKLIPFMSIGYVLGCLIILALNAPFIFPAIKTILISAFNPTAAGSGFVGATITMAMRYGVARGLFSNESGLGSAPIVAAAAKTERPIHQALVSATGTFWDTVVICAMTGLVLVSTMMKSPDLFIGLKGAALTKAAFNTIPYIGSPLLIFGLFTFVFSTILGWQYYGERALEYLAGKRSIKIYRLSWVVAVYIGSIMALPLVWDLSDMMNALMAIPNLISLLLLSNLLARETKNEMNTLK